LVAPFDVDFVTICADVRFVTRPQSEVHATAVCVRHDRPQSIGSAMTFNDIEVGAAGTDTIVLTLQGCLDGEAGQMLLEATTSAAAAHARRVEIVLDGLESFTDDGAAALCRCARLHTTVPGGVALRAGGGVGRQALLAACSQIV
jgi:hypothetical protein